MENAGKCPDCGHIHIDAKALTGVDVLCRVKCEACGQRNHHSDVWIRSYREHQSQQVAKSNPGGLNRVWVALDSRITTFSDAASHSKIVVEGTTVGPEPSASFTTLDIGGHDGGSSGALQQIVKHRTVNRVWRQTITKQEFLDLTRKVLIGIIPSPMTQDEFLTQYAAVMDEDRALGYEPFTHNCRSTVNATLARAVQNKHLLLDESFAKNKANCDCFLAAVDKMLYSKVVRLPDGCGM